MPVSTADHRAYQEAARAVVPADLLFPDVLDAYQTVWGFLFEHEPWVLTTMGDPVAGLVEDDCRARREAVRMREAAVTLVAPEALRAARAGVIGAFPRAVLERVYAV
jgi:hypothetical protein